LHSVKRLVMSVAVAVIHKVKLVRTHAGLAVHAAKDSLSLLQKVIYT